jgi:hypothetical protein
MICSCFVMFVQFLQIFDQIMDPLGIQKLVQLATCFKPPVIVYLSNHL